MKRLTKLTNYWTYEINEAVNTKKNQLLLDNVTFGVYEKVETMLRNDVRFVLSTFWLLPSAWFLVNFEDI